MSSDSDDASIPLLKERMATIRDDVGEIKAMLKEISQRLHSVETGRSQRFEDLDKRIDGSLERIGALEQWRRDMETAQAAVGKAKEPYARVWWLGVGAVFVMALTGFAVIMWRIVIAATANGVGR